MDRLGVLCSQLRNTDPATAAPSADSAAAANTRMQQREQIAVPAVAALAAARAAAIAAVSGPAAVPSLAVAVSSSQERFLFCCSLHLASICSAL